MKVYEIPNQIKTAVYLLYNDNEVVYVGQTKSGLKRIMQHNNKIFNRYSFIECCVDDLDYFEDIYIMKFQPKYNHFYNYSRMSLESCYRKLKYQIQKQINLNQFIDFVEKSGVEVLIFKGIKTILKKDFYYILKKISEEYGEK